MDYKEKQLLLKDLSMRLPYGVKGIITYDENIIFTLKGIFNILFLSDTECCHVEDFKPYLRPMSSMTEEERKEYKHLVAFSGSSYGAADLVDWLNKKMFAYRNIDGKDMFELGLALVAPEEMYN